jgi:hypothetical protein
MESFTRDDNEESINLNTSSFIKWGRGESSIIEESIENSGFN